MRRIIVLFLLAGIAAVGFSQTTGLESVQSDSSFGVFENELDAALTVTEDGNRPGFSDLENKMIFGGNSNLNLVESDATFTAASFDPLWVGLFMPGDTPFSLFLGSFASGATGNQASDVVSTTTTKAGIVSGSTTTDFEWVSTTVDTEYSANRLFDDFEKSAQFIMPLGDMNIGLGAQFVLADASDQTLNFVRTTTESYDTAVATAEPNVATDYVQTETSTDLNRTSIVSLIVPVFLETGDLGHTITPFASFDRTNASSTFSESFTNSADAGLGATTVTEANNTTLISGSIAVGAGYDLVMPALFGDDPLNQFHATLGADARFYNGTYEDVLTTQVQTWAGAGAAPTNGERNDDTITSVIEGGIDFGFDIGASHSFYYDLGSAIRVGVIPSVDAQVSLDNEDWTLASVTDIDRADGNTDGDFADAGDTITTDVTTFTNTAIDPGTLLTGAAVNDLQIVTEFALAGAIEVTPGDWPFSITLGSRPRFVLTNTRTTTLSDSSSAATDVVDGTGAAVGGTTVVQSTTGDSSAIWDSAVTIDAEHRIGLNMILSDAVRLDVALSLSSGLNVLDFRDLVIQTIVKLP